MYFSWYFGVFPLAFEKYFGIVSRSLDFGRISGYSKWAFLNQALLPRALLNQVLLKQALLNGALLNRRWWGGLRPPHTREGRNWELLVPSKNNEFLKEHQHVRTWRQALTILLGIV